jgi:hypothetical protein
MARHDVFIELVVEHRTIAQGKVRANGDSPVEAAAGWVRDLNLVEPMQLDVRPLGRKALTLLYWGERTHVRLVPVFDAGHQCPDCGWPADETNDNCFGGCSLVRARQYEDEGLVHAFYAERRRV